MHSASDVRTLFNGKASAWQGKYGLGGALPARRDGFVARVGELCPPPNRVLDLGCGTGDIAGALAAVGYGVVGCDIAESMIEVARSRWKGARVEWVPLTPGWTRLPFPEGIFGCVVAASVFEYLDDLGGVTAEIARVLGPGGALVFTVPNPFSGVRRAEAWLRHLLPERGLPPDPGRFRRTWAYTSYLRLSRNRFSGERWMALLSRAGLVPSEEREFAEQVWRRNAKSALILLAARKPGYCGQPRETASLQTR